MWSASPGRMGALGGGYEEQMILSQEQELGFGSRGGHRASTLVTGAEN